MPLFNNVDSSGTASWFSQEQLRLEENKAQEPPTQGEQAPQGIRVNAGTTQAIRPAPSRSSQSAPASLAAGWNAFPLVLTQSVFENFDPADFANASSVCRAWLRAGIRSLHTLRLTNQAGEIDVDRTRAAVELLLRSSENTRLQRLELSESEPLWTDISQQECDARMGRLLTKCPRLRHLSACDVEAFALVELRNLTSLHMGHAEKHPAFTFAGLPELSGLRTLIVSLDGKAADRARVTDAELAVLQHAPQIEKLSLWGSNEITDAGLMYLPEGLSALDLGHAPAITEAGLEHVTRLRNPRVLTNLPPCWLTDLGTSRLAHLTGLQHIGTDRAGHLTDTGLERLSSLHALHSLDVSGTRLTTSAGWKAFLEAAHQLRHLTARNCFSGECLESLPPGLLSLDVLGSQRIYDIQLAHLPRLQALEELNLSYCRRITEEGLRHLAGLPRLKTLKVQGLDLSESQVAQLSTLMPGVRILR